MAYRKFYRASKPQPRVITVKYAGQCACCTAPIAAGEVATYYPPGTLASRTEGAIAHVGGLDGTSARCSAEIRQRSEARAIDDYAGSGLDQRCEDQFSDICGRGEG